MKTFKIITIASDGSLTFSYSSMTLGLNKFIYCLRQDEKNFSFNQKKSKVNTDSKQSSYYKKKYLKR